ncbi:MAG: hypothetical protein WEF50_03745 [Myxococcota bacterium]
MHSIHPPSRSALLPLLVLVLAALAPLGARAGSSSAIVRESVREIDGGGGRVASFWWLPQEYWEQVAKELAIPAEEQAKVRAAFRDYLLVGAFEFELSTEKQPEFATIAEISKRATFYRDGEKVEVLREVNPELARLAPSLVYLLRASLAGLGEGLRLLPLSNVDSKGKPILAGGAPGELRLEYRFDEKSPAQAVYWRAPLTSIAGVKKCPSGGESLEASFEFCPWHGVRVEPKP